MRPAKLHPVTLATLLSTLECFGARVRVRVGYLFIEYRRIEVNSDATCTLVSQIKNIKFAFGSDPQVRGASPMHLVNERRLGGYSEDSSGWFLRESRTSHLA